MSTQALLVEALLSGFFAIACFRTRAESTGMSGFAPRRFMVLTDRLERLRKTRWQWCSIVVVLILIRMQNGSPLVAELTALTQFIVFLALPAKKKSSQEAMEKKAFRAALRRS